MAGMDLDQQIGSLLEAWLTRDTDGCRFCNAPLSGDPAPNDQFCTSDCREKFDDIMEARTHLGSRDLEQRGYD